MPKFFIGFVLATLIGGTTYFIGKSEPVAAQIKLKKIRKGDPLPSDLFINLAKAVNPAVVNISITEAPWARSQQRRRRDPFFDMFEQFMGPMPQRRPRQGLGTGFIIRKDGLIITNNHVVDGGSATIIKVQLSGDTEKTYEAELIGRDERTDIALIKIDAKKDLPSVKLGSSKDVEVGEWIAAFGNPFGQSNTLTVGVVSFIGRQIDQLNSLPFIQTDASINPGNSGGPLVNVNGEVVGVNTAIFSQTGGSIGIGFAIPIDDVKKLLPALEKNGGIVRGFLGVYLQDLTPYGAESLGLSTTEGSMVAQVEEGSPADKAGIKPYDFVTQFGKRKVQSSSDLINAVKDTPVGSKVKVTYIRNGKKKTTTAKLVPHPDSKPIKKLRKKTYVGQKAPFDLGFKVANWSPRLKREFDLPELRERHPVVIGVEMNSPASKSGLNTGDIILDVNKEKVSSAKDVLKKLKNKKMNLLRVIRGDSVRLIYLRK